MPGSPHTDARDPALRCRYVTSPRRRADRPRAVELLRLRRQQCQPDPGARRMSAVSAWTWRPSSVRAGSAGLDREPGCAGAATRRIEPAPIVLEAPAQLSAGGAAAGDPVGEAGAGRGRQRGRAVRGSIRVTLPAVFASSGADGETIGAILSAWPRRRARYRRPGSTTRSTTRRRAIGASRCSRARRSPASAATTRASRRGCWRPVCRRWRVGGRSCWSPTTCPIRIRCTPCGRLRRASAWHSWSVPNHRRGRWRNFISRLPHRVTRPGVARPG